MDDFLFLIFVTETISRTDKGQPRPKYIFNKCGTNIYFFLLHRGLVHHHHRILNGRLENQGCIIQWVPLDLDAFHCTENVVSSDIKIKTSYDVTKYSGGSDAK